eukprot:SAG11_NODE_32629_length_282_cov_0.650273_1_plen_44_part_10
MLALAASLAASLAAPVANRTAALSKTTCPSLYGPGAHTIELRIV